MARNAQRAKYPLPEVQNSIRNAFIGRRVRERTALDYPLDPSEVERFIRKVILELETGAFVCVEMQNYRDRPPIPADIYAVKNDEGVWYVKFCMENGNVTILSCHEPDERPLHRVDGKVIRVRR